MHTHAADIWKGYELSRSHNDLPDLRFSRLYSLNCLHAAHFATVNCQNARILLHVPDQWPAKPNFEKKKMK